jgi:hypothetical protein
MKLKMDCRTKCYQFCFDLKDITLNVSFNARNSLVTEFVPKHLDFEHRSHEELSQNHTTTFAKTLFTNDNSQAVVVLDGTCIYSEKLELQVPKEIIYHT